MDVGDEAPDLELDGTGGRRRLRPRPGGRLLVIFYQEDSTPTCSIQLNAFKRDFDILSTVPAEVVAISTDSLTAHHDFVARLGGLPFPLLSDASADAANAFGVLDSNELRAQRALFVVDESGIIQYAAAPFNPSNLTQYEQAFQALGFDAGSD
jgi:peroxiredoxin